MKCNRRQQDSWYNKITECAFKRNAKLFTAEKVRHFQIDVTARSRVGDKVKIFETHSFNTV